MNFKNWFSKRGTKYVQQRANRLLERYQISPTRAIQRINTCLEGLVEQGCFPTFPTPGIVLERYPVFFRHLQEEGAEIAVHGYQHVNLKSYPANEACRQLVKAAGVFKNHGIEFYGFRCPYLGCSEELLEALPKGFFGYSSNKAIFWNVLNDNDHAPYSLIFDTLNKLYGAELSVNAISVPSSRTNLLEIPVSLPDDLELIDGLNYSPAGAADTWCHILDQTHQRGELFNFMFHPELASLYVDPFFEVLRCAKSMLPRVWIATLGEISDWWSEKSSFKVETTETRTGLRLDFKSSNRATILIKGFDLHDARSAWLGNYQRLQATTLELPVSPRPFLGLSASIPPKINAFLKDQGYILDTTETASRCGIYLDNTILERLVTETSLIEYIEAYSGPFVRYWRWPDGARSALSITGDVDALSLLDYLSRVYKS